MELRLGIHLSDFANRLVEAKKVTALPPEMQLSWRLPVLPFPHSTLKEINVLSPRIPPLLPGPKREKMRKMKIKCTVSVDVLMSGGKCVVSVQRLSNLPAGSYLGNLGAKPGKQTKPEIPSNS